MKSPTFVVASSGASALAYCLQAGAASLVLDVEPVVTPWGTTPAELRTAVTATLIAARVAGVRRVVFVTNSARTVEPFPHGADLADGCLISRARKPLSATRVLGDLPRPLHVAGDQILLDGILAYRLDADVFVLAPVPATAPLWPRIQAVVAMPLTRFLFRAR
jgi:hypothetical protein